MTLHFFTKSLSAV